MRSSRDIDQQILAIAAAKESVVHASDMRAIHATTGMVRGRVETGFMAPIEPRTYGVGPDAAAPTHRMRCMAAVMHAGPGSFIDGTTAARMRKVWDRGPAAIHVIGPRNVRRSADPAVRYHRVSPAWVPRDPGRDGALPVVGFLDMCVRVSQQLTKWQLASIIARGIYLRMVTLDDLVGASIARGTAPGSATFRGAVQLVASGSVGTRSATEDAVLRDLLEAGIREPLVNVRGCMGLYRDEPDIVLLDRRFNLEIDGPQHDEPAQAADDARRDADARRRGWAVMRLRVRDYWRNPRGSIRRVLRCIEG